MGHEEGEGGGGHELASVLLSESLPGKVGVASRKLYVHTVLYCTPRVRYALTKFGIHAGSSPGIRKEWREVFTV